MQGAFILPVDGNDVNITNVKMKFSNNSLSDHQMLLKLFEQWSNQTDKNQFCKENFLSNYKMETIQNTKKLILDYLKKYKLTTNFTNALNKNSSKWEIVKSCLVAGLYPNVCSISDSEILSENRIQLCPHRSSVLCGFRGQLDYDVQNVNAKWLIHCDKTISRNLILLHNISLIPHIDIALFAGSRPLSERNIRQCSGNNNALVNIQIDEYINVTTMGEYGILLLRLRQMFLSMISRYLQCHEYFYLTQEDMEMLEVLFSIISQEDNIERGARELL